MKKIITMVAVAGVVFGLLQVTPVVAHAGQNQSGHIFSGMMGNFIDLNGDGINDNALDADGDGVLNGQDPDFVRPQDGSGVGLGAGTGTGTCTTTGTNSGGRRGR